MTYILILLIIYWISLERYETRRPSGGCWTNTPPKDEDEGCGK